MDYSAGIHDADHPAGASPWGSSPGSSPRHTRTAFGQGTSDPPGSPLGASTAINNRIHHEHDSGGFGGSEAGFGGTTVSGSVAGESQSEEPSQQESQGSAPGHWSGSSQQHEDDKAIRSEVLPPSDPRTQEQARQAQEAQARRQAGPQFKLQAKITGLERTGRKDPVLRFDVHTNIPSFRTTQYRDVRRLHSEFVKLAEHLISANPECIVPAVPPSVTSAGAGTDEDEAIVKGLMQRWFNYVFSNEVLMQDDEVVLFVESDFGYSPVLRKKQPATGVRRKILKQFAPPPDDTPELQEARPIVKLFYLGTMDAGHKVDKLVKSRRGLGLAESDFGVKLGGMHVQEPHPGLANAYRKLGKVVQTVGDCHAAQATAEATTIGDAFQYHSQDAFIVKETLTNRQLLSREFVQAQEQTRSKLNAADRLKASSNVRREKVDEAIASLDEARQNESYLFQKTTRVTQNLVHERRRWFARTAADLRQSIRDYVLREIEAERRTLALLETVRPDVRAIDASGGLSRLGREAHPAVRRSSLAQSQGPKGDAWSGVPRRSETARSVAGSVMGSLPEDDGDEEAENGGGGESGAGRTRALSGGGRALAGLGTGEDDDEDRVDARNAASRLATSTF